MQIIYVISEFLIWIKVISNQTNYTKDRFYNHYELREYKGSEYWTKQN